MFGDPALTIVPRLRHVKPDSQPDADRLQEVGWAALTVELSRSRRYGPELMLSTSA